MTEQSVYEQMGGQGNVEVLGLCNYYTVLVFCVHVGGQDKVEGLGLYITHTQSCPSMNTWVVKVL